MANIKKTTENKTCLTCLTPKNGSRNFYKSYSNWHKDGLQPICKQCLKDFIKGKEDNPEIVKEVMRIVDKPFRLEEWKKALKDERDTLGIYFKNINFNFSEDTYDDSDKSNTDKESSGETTVKKTQLSDDNVFVQEDKVYSKKWLGYYTPSEIEYLEQYYTGLDRDFRVVTLSHKDYAKKIAKASLYMDICFQEMQNGVTGAEREYKEAKDVFDTLSKSAKFSESQRGVTDVGMGSISQIVEMVESETWVYEHKNDLDKDTYDKLIDDFQHIYKSL